LPNPNPEKNAIISLILGIVSILPVTAFLLALFLALVAPGFMYFGATRGQSILVMYTWIALIYFSPISFLTGVAGVLLGKIGFKSTKKSLAIIGIILSILGLGSSIYFLLELIT